MKKIAVLSVLAVLALAIGSWAQQPAPGKKFELSTSASLWVTKSAGESEFETIISVPVRLGIALVGGLALEPEAFLTFQSWGNETSTGILGMLNLTYSFRSGGTSIPFLLAGGGYGNGPESFKLVADTKTGIAAWNVGAGVKILFAEAAALRIEYRFIRYSGKYTESSSYYGATYSYTYDYGRTDHKILVGISLFL